LWCADPIADEGGGDQPAWAAAAIGAGHLGAEGRLAFGVRDTSWNCRPALYRDREEGSLEVPQPTREG